MFFWKVLQNAVEICPRGVKNNSFTFFILLHHVFWQANILRLKVLSWSKLYYGVVMPPLYLVFILLNLSRQGKNWNKYIASQFRIWKTLEWPQFLTFDFEILHRVLISMLSKNGCIDWTLQTLCLQILCWQALQWTLCCSFFIVPLFIMPLSIVILFPDPQLLQNLPQFEASKFS